MNVWWWLSLCADIHLFGVRAEATSDNASVRVSWQWSRQGLLTCVDLVRVHYQPQRGSLMMYTVNNTTATSATLPNLQCNTDYTIWVYASGGKTGTTSVHRMVFLPARGRIAYVWWSLIQCTCNGPRPNSRSWKVIWPTDILLIQEKEAYTYTKREQKCGHIITKVEWAQTYNNRNKYEA